VTHIGSVGPPQELQSQQLFGNRGSWSEGRHGRSFCEPAAQWNDIRTQGGPPQRPISTELRESGVHLQQPRRHLDEEIAISRGGVRAGPPETTTKQSGSEQQQQQQQADYRVNAEKRGFGHTRGGPLPIQTESRQSGTEWSRNEPIQRSSGRIFQGSSQENFHGDNLPYSRSGPPHPTFERGPKSGSFRQPSERPTFSHQVVGQQLTAVQHGTGSGPFEGHLSDQNFGRSGLSEIDHGQSGLPHNRHRATHQDPRPSADFSSTKWEREGRSRGQKKDPPSENMQDLIRRSKEFQSRRRQSPDREQFMNPPNPNATSPGGGGGNEFNTTSQGNQAIASTSSVPTDSSGAPAPDYKALLQYLQFYQKQMGGGNPDHE